MDFFTSLSTCQTLFDLTLLRQLHQMYEHHTTPSLVHNAAGSQRRCDSETDKRKYFYKDFSVLEGTPCSQLGYFYIPVNKLELLKPSSLDV